MKCPKCGYWCQQHWLGCPMCMTQVGEICSKCEKIESLSRPEGVCINKAASFDQNLDNYQSASETKTRKWRSLNFAVTLLLAISSMVGTMIKWRFWASTSDLVLKVMATWLVITSLVFVAFWNIDRILEKKEKLEEERGRQSTRIHTRTKLGIGSNGKNGANR